MSLPGNGIFVVQGEMNMLVTAMRRSTRWGSHSFPNEEYDVLMKTFQDLKTILYQVDDLRLLDPATYLGPFLEVIRSKETTGPVTSLALSAIHKFLSYGLIDPTHPSVPATVEDIAEAVTHARFVGTDHSSDGVVLMKILQVLRTLMLSPEGVMLTDESVCEIMLSCFRICFETRLTELLRRNAEQCLRDMTQLVFMRLPQFPAEDAAAAALPTAGLCLKKRDKPNKRKSLTSANSTNSLERKSSLTEQTTSTENVVEVEVTKTEVMSLSQDKNLINEAEITIEPVESTKSPVKKHGRHSSMDLQASGNTSISQLLEKCVSGDTEQKQDDIVQEKQDETTDPDGVCVSKQETDVVEVKTDKTDQQTDQLEEYVNHRGIRFTPQQEQAALQPYSLLCVRELFRFLISLCNPLDSQNTSGMVHLGLSLVATALEVAADSVPDTPSLLLRVKDPLARNLLTLLNTERISIFALDLQVSFLLFESMRYHLKFQMEAYFKKLIEIISADTSKAIYELKEIHHLALESLIQFFKIPDLCAELYLNYDCDVYCLNVFEEITKLLSKLVVSASAYDTHQLSLEALLTILEAIEVGSQKKSEMEIVAVEGEKEPKYGRDGHVTLELGGMEDSSVSNEHVTHDISQYVSGSRRRRSRPHAAVPTEAELDNIKNIKKWVTQGTELFNQKPERGIEFLQEHGVLKTPLDPHEVAMFLRENPDLDKKMIGEYICKRSCREVEGEDEANPSGGVLGAFADSFSFAGLRIEQALRMYLETFRLPGEAPLIFLVMERFAERWHTTNGEPFANTDAAFRLAYAVIMLNMDQHNHNAKKLNVPMTVEDFVKNLRGCNGSGDFDQTMLEQIFHSIKNEEMIMPAERTGAVRDAYLWRVLQRRGATPAGRYRVPGAHHHHARLFALAAPHIVSALSAAFERAPAPSLSELEAALGGSAAPQSMALVALGGLERAAALVARLPPDALTLDSLLLSLCKFTQLLNYHFTNYVAVGVTLGQSTKSRAALSRACAVYLRHAHGVRAAWRHLLDVLTALFLGRLLPQCLVEVEDYLSGGRVSLVREVARGPDSGLLSSIYSYIALGDTGGMRVPTPHEKALIDIAVECVAKCNFPGLLITETKFLQVESLQELVQAMIAAGTPPDPESLQMNPQLEDVTIFYLELLGQLLIQNRDRLQCVWGWWSAHVSRCVWWCCARAAPTPARALTCVVRTAARLLRAHHTASHALHHLHILLQLPYRVFYTHADLISCGIYELVKTSAQNLHSSEEWELVLTVLCAAGAGAWPRNRPSTALAGSTSSRSEGSEDESERRPQSASSESELSHSPQTQGWIMVQKESSRTSPTSVPPLDEEWSDVVVVEVCGAALARSCETLSLVVRDVAHVTPHNCRHAVRAARLLARAARHHNGKRTKKLEERKSRSRTRHEESSDDEVDTLDQYHMVSLQLLDLMHTLHSRTAQIFKWWKDEADQEGNTCAEEYDLWEVAWKPLLQGIAEFCTDRRKQIANSGIAYLQRALLAPGLAGVGGAGWEQCFTAVLFPLLDRVAGPRLARANTILCKVFLQHLSALAPRAGFPQLWARVVGVQRALILKHGDDALAEAARESLKNMILVMDSVRIFSNGEEYNDLWYMTWNMIEEFLPNLKDELFPQVKDKSKPPTSLPSHMQVPLPSSLPTIIPVGPATKSQVTPQNSPPTNIVPNSLPSSQSAFVPVSPSMVNVGQSPVNFTQSQGNVGQPPVTFIQSQGNVGQSPVNIMQSTGTIGLSPVNVILTQGNVGKSPVNIIQSQGNVAQSPINVGHTILAPSAVTGMVPIRNSLYDQAGLTSSVLLQPLNEMKSTPIGVSLSQPQPIAQPIDSNLTDSLNIIQMDPNVEQEELYAEYLTNPYNDAKISIKEATIYDPELPKELNPLTKENFAENNSFSRQNIAEINPLLKSSENLTEIESLHNQKSIDNLAEINALLKESSAEINPLLKPKSLSENTTPLHRNMQKFGSTDNVKESGIFNFSSYFSSSEKGAEVFDSLITREG